MSRTPATTLCPSAQPHMQDARVLGVVDRQSGEPRVSYLQTATRVTPELLAAAAPVPPLAVLRLSAVCERTRCSHFAGELCTLAARIVENLQEVSSTLPPCNIRKNCRWYAERGRPACVRCPQVVTESNRAAVNPILLDGAETPQSA